MTVHIAATYSNMKSYLHVSVDLPKDGLIKAGFRSVPSKQTDDKVFITTGTIEKTDDFGTMTVTYQTGTSYVTGVPPSEWITVSLTPANPTPLSQDVVSAMISRAVEHEVDLALRKHTIVTEQWRPTISGGKFTERIVISLDGKIESMTLRGYK
jgi:hypothetical protein